MSRPQSSRRRMLLKGLGALAAAAALPAARGRDAGSITASRHEGTVPRSGERVPAIGLGTWITFNVPPFTEARERRVAVLRAFFDNGGAIVDSSPMYGLSEATVGHCLEQLGDPPALFSATKVWTPTRIAGVAQMNVSASLWGLPGFDLMQVHNMVDWEAHLETLREWRGEGRIRYIGISTSHGRRHAAMERVIEQQEDFEFVQFTYNIGDREAERRLLPAAAANGKAVIVNRPYRRGALIDALAGKPLPGWAAEIGCSGWPQALLKFIVSHPAVTCTIPATSRIDHMVENMGALAGALPDAALRRRMAADFDRLV